MCVINTSSSVKKLSWADYSERTQGFTKGKDIISGTSIGENFEVAANGTMIIELSK